MHVAGVSRRPKLCCYRLLRLIVSTAFTAHQIVGEAGADGNPAAQIVRPALAS